MSAMKQVIEELQTYELLDWYADTYLDRCTDDDKVNEAFRILNWFRTGLMIDWNVNLAQFNEVWENYLQMTEDLIDAGLQVPDTEYEQNAIAMFNYYSQAYKAQVA